MEIKKHEWAPFWSKEDALKYTKRTDTQYVSMDYQAIKDRGINDPMIECLKAHSLLVVI